MDLSKRDAGAGIYCTLGWTQAKYQPVPLRGALLGSSTGVIIAPYHEKRVLAISMLGGLEIALTGRKSGSNSGLSLPQAIPRP